MSDDEKKPQAKVDEKKVDEKQPRPVRVAKLLFMNSIRLPTGMDGEARDTQLIIAGKTPTGIIEISYEPWHRHHRVRRYAIASEAVRGELQGEFCIPESWAAYLPEQPTTRL